MSTFDDMCDSDDEEWFYNSIKKYNDLLIYEFQGSITSSWFCTDDKLLVACHRETCSEILELAIADKLIATDDTSIIKNRDFKVLSAGYSLNKVSMIVSCEENVITSESDGINLYNFGGMDSDLITFKSSIRKEGGLSYPIISLDRQDIEVCLFSGTCFSNIKCYNLNSQKLLNYPLIDCVSDKSFCKLSFLNSNANYIYCGLHEEGYLNCSDLRSKAKISTINLERNIQTNWFYNVSQSGTKFALCNYLGEINIFDSRNQSEEYFKTVIEHSPDSQNYQNMKLNFDNCENCVSISGFDISVFVFSLNTDEKNNLRFVHDGHKKRAQYISDHFWHPSVENVIFSTDNVGTLQAWKMK